MQSTVISLAKCWRLLKLDDGYMWTDIIIFFIYSKLAKEILIIRKDFLDLNVKHLSCIYTAQIFSLKRISWQLNSGNNQIIYYLNQSCYLNPFCFEMNLAGSRPLLFFPHFSFLGNTVLLHTWKCASPISCAIYWWAVSHPAK